jgi:formylglycine-generating enzyme required for sulfatase activity
MTQGINTVVHNGSANVWLPTENEWYKAAYYQPAVAGGDTDSYWLYPTQSNAIPTIATADASGNITNDGADVVNYSQGAIWNYQSGLTTVGSAGATSDSYYGAYDLGGNVWEWNEAITDGRGGLRGGSWSTNYDFIRATDRDDKSPASDANVNIGFRLAGAVPEPSRMMLCLAGLCSLFLRRRRLPCPL